MLDMGFKKEVDEIINYIPKNRQTLLFSATVPDELRSVMAATMKKDFVTVDCIKEDSSHTNSQVEQAHVVIPSSTRMVTGTVEILLNLIQGKEQPVKLVVFFPTAHMVAFYAALFNNGLKIPVSRRVSIPRLLTSFERTIKAFYSPAMYRRAELTILE